MARSEIIKQFASGNIKTEIALRQLKVLLFSFDNQEFMDWVDKELSGYNIDDEIPSYRKAGASLKGSVMKFSVQINNIGIPIRQNAPVDLIDYCNSYSFRESIGALQLLLESEGPLVVSVPPDIYPLIVTNAAIRITSVLNAQLSVSRSNLSGIISSVDKKILDILLCLEKEFGLLDNYELALEDKSETELADIKKQIQTIIYYDNSITVGNNNKINDSIIDVNGQIRKE